MVTAGLLLSLVIPLLAGLPWILALQRDAPVADGKWGIAVGYGYTAGLLAVVASMQIASHLGQPMNFWTASMLPLVTGGLGWFRYGKRIASSARIDFAGARDSWRRMPNATRIVCVVALGFIALRLGTVAVESVLRPLFPWEAVSGTAAKARVWFEYSRLIPFVTPSAMLDLTGVYTNADPNAPSLPSLLMVWTASCMHDWHEGGVGFAWWGLGVALACAFYGHLRKVGCGVAYSIVFSYALISLPLVDAHIALPGSPQWIGAAGVGLAGCALMRWLDTQSRETFLCAAAGMILAVCSIPTTWPWFAIFALAAVMTRVPSIARKVAIGLSVAAVIGVLALMQSPLKVGGMSLRIQLSPEWSEAPESLLLLDNWHLLFGVVALVLITGLRTIFTPSWLPRTWVVGMGLGLMVLKGAFALPPWWFGGLRDFSYAGLQFAAILLLWIAWTGRDIALARSTSTAPASPDVERSGTDVSG